VCLLQGWVAGLSYSVPATGLGFRHGKKYFCRDSGKKPVKTGNNWQKVQYINWILPITDININGHINDVDIANDVVAHFKRVFTSSGDDVEYSEFMCIWADYISDDVQSSCEWLLLNLLINVWKT